MIQRHQPGCGRHPAGMVAARLERGSAGWSFFWYSWPRWWLPSRAGSVSRTVWGPHLLLDRGWGGGGRGAVAESGAERVGWCGDRHWVYRRGFGVSAEHRGQPGREGRDHRGGDLCLGALGAAAGEGSWRWRPWPPRWSSSAWSCSTSRPCRYWTPGTGSTASPMTNPMPNRPAPTLSHVTRPGLRADGGSPRRHPACGGSAVG